MAKDNSKNSSRPILGQLLSLIPKEIFQEAVKESQSDKWYKKVRSWDQFVFMFYAILIGSSSLREVIANFALMGDKLVHCGKLNVPKRSTLSDSSAKRKSEVFAKLYQKLYSHYKPYLSDSYLVCP